MAVGLLFLLPGGLVQAQDADGPIMYAENGTGPVATFTATDPELAGAVTWSLATGDDAEDFEIDKASGVLSFMKSPNYEMATGGGANGTSNTYSVTVVATDADSVTSEETVTVEVTNVDEAGEVTLSAVAPHPAVVLTATHSDPDEVVSASEEWQWSRSSSKSGSYADIEGAEAAAYTPTSGDVGYYLMATVSYDDRAGDGKSTMATSAHEVQAINVPNATPAFLDQDPDDAGVQNTVATRMVGENVGAGVNVGAPVAAEDDDSDILTYTLDDDTDASSFEIDPATGQITVGDDTELDFETKSTYMVMVTATDPAAVRAVIDVTINVVDDANEPPAITGTVPDSFDEELTGNELTVVTFMAEDPDPDNNITDITWSLSGPDAGDFTITGGVLTFRESPNYEMPADADGDNVYEVRVAATDADSNRGEMSVEVKVANVNEDGTVTLSAVQPRVGVSLTASLTDPDGGVSGVEWQWNNGGDNGGDIDGATSDTYTPVATDAGDTLTVTASYTDAQGPEKTANFVYAVAVAADTRNKPPVFADQDDKTEGTQNTEAERTIAENSGADTALNGGGPVVAEDSNDGDELTYTLGGPDASSFDISSVGDEGQITVGAGTELDYETKRTYMVTVIATDSFGASASIDVTINVTDENEGPVIMRAPDANVAPEFASATTSRTVAENTAAGEDIGNPVAANDANGDTLTYALVGTDAASFNVGSDTGQLMTLAALDYETKATYSVTVTASDSGGLRDSIDVTITVTNEEEMGEVTLWAGADALTMAPQVGDTITGAVMDPDGGVTGESWQWAKTKTPAMMDSWMPSTGATNAAYMVTEGDTGYHLRVMATYTDAAGTDMAMEDSPATMMVTAMMTVPMFDSETATREVAENTEASMDIGAPVTATDADGDALDYTLGGTDAASFDINPETGQLKTLAALDYETTATYEVMVTATDPDSASDMITVTITVTNVDEMGEVTLWAGTDALTMAPQVGDTITGAVIDPDSGVTGESWQWAKTKTPAMMDSWMPITGATGAAYMVTEGDTGYHLRVMATYTDAAGTDMAMEDSPATMMVTAMMTVPMFDSETATREVAENTEASMDIGAPVTATDADGDALDYTLGGTDAASFDINPETGQLKTLAALDYETKATYEVMVTATDPDSASDMITVTITVTNVDEMGRVTLWAGADALTMAPQVGDTITGDVMDPDGGVTGETWQWAKTKTPDMMASWMDIDGETNAAYMVMEGDTGYSLRVMATYTDAVGTDMDMAYSMPTMMVTAVDEMGRVTLWAGADALTMAPQVGDTITGDVMDPDGGVTGETWQWARTKTPDMMASWMDIDGETNAAYMVMEGDTGYSLRVMATYTDAVGTDMDMAYSMPTMMVTAVDEQEPEDPVERYDVNNSGRIDKDELADGVFDYNIEQTLSKDDLADLIFSYEKG